MQCSGRLTARTEFIGKEKATPMAYVCMLSLPVSFFLSIFNFIHQFAHCPTLFTAV